MVKITYLIGTPNAISVDSSHFADLCKTGCPVYGHKWSCPPFSPGFLINQWLPFHIIILKGEWTAEDVPVTQEFTKVKAINATLKSKLFKLLRQYPTKNVLGSASCRLCQKCNYPDPCKHQDKKIPSLEACGIDVESMCKVMGHDLQWYRKGQKEPYKYGSVVGLIKGSTEARIKEQLDEILGIKPVIPVIPAIPATTTAPEPAIPQATPAKLKFFRLMEG